MSVPGVAEEANCPGVIVNEENGATPLEATMNKLY